MILYLYRFNLSVSALGISETNMNKQQQTFDQKIEQDISIEAKDWMPDA
ncbi:MAG TPA: 1,2-phenylacetyl-CoA epoxidase subunit A, partial [Acinetobacter sp.]|nr:1,2-phenylacetyl-CoA epoxidase subunit A [Acinetobacter sp.]